MEFISLSEDVSQGLSLNLRDRDLPTVIGMGYMGMSDIYLIFVYLTTLLQHCFNTAAHYS